MPFNNTTFGSQRQHVGQLPTVEMGNSVPAGDFIGDAYNSYQRGLDQGQDRQLRREQAMYTKTLRDQQLKELGMWNANNGPELQLQQMRAQLEQQTAQAQAVTKELDKRSTFDAFDKFTADKETRHLNSLLKNPRIKDMLGNIVSIDKLNPADIEDQRMLSQEIGRDISLAFDQGAIDTEALRARVLKLTDQEGNKKLVDMQQIYAMTGYANELDSRKQATLMQGLELAAKQANINKTNAEAGKAERWMPGQGANGNGTAMTANAKAVDAARDRLKMGAPEQGDRALVEMHGENIAGNTAGKQSMLDTEEETLYSTFGGEESFYSTQFTPGTVAYRTAERSVRKLEAASGVKLTNKQIETVGNIRKTIAAATSAKGLTNADVGLVDNTLKQFGAYVSNDAVGTEARSAWAGIRNQLLHAFAGSAMNEGELARWGEQFGNLNQQGGHILTTLASSLDQLGGELDALRLALPEASFHVRLGTDVEQLNTIITNVRTAAATLSNRANPKGKVTPTPPSYPVTQGSQRAPQMRAPQAQSSVTPFSESPLPEMSTQEQLGMSEPLSPTAGQDLRAGYAQPVVTPEAMQFLRDSLNQRGATR